MYFRVMLITFLCIFSVKGSLQHHRRSKPRSKQKELTQEGKKLSSHHDSKESTHHPFAESMASNDPISFVLSESNPPIIKFNSKSSNSSSSPIPSFPSPPFSKTMSYGVSFSYYLIHCTVFIDENDNGVWEKNESKNVTDIHGRYFFSKATKGSLLLSSEPPCFDRSIGSESSSSDLTAPASSHVISPLTTLVHHTTSFLLLNLTEANSLVGRGLRLGSLDFSSSGEGMARLGNVNRVSTERNLLITMMQVRVLDSFGRAILCPNVEYKNTVSKAIYRAVVFYLWKLISRRQSKEKAVGMKKKTAWSNLTLILTLNSYLDLSSDISVKNVFDLSRNEISSEFNFTAAWPNSNNVSYSRAFGFVVNACALVNGYLEALKPGHTGKSNRKSNMERLLIRNGYASTDLHRLVFALGVIGQKIWPDVVRNWTCDQNTSSSASTSLSSSSSSSYDFSIAFSQSNLISELNTILKWNTTSFEPGTHTEPAFEPASVAETSQKLPHSSNQQLWVIIVLSVTAFVLLFVFVVSVAFAYFRYSQNREESNKRGNHSNSLSFSSSDTNNNMAMKKDHAMNDHVMNDHAMNDHVMNDSHANSKMMSNSTLLSSNIPVYEVGTIPNPPKKKKFGIPFPLLPPSLTLSRSISSKINPLFRTNNFNSFSRLAKPPDLPTPRFRNSPSSNSNSHSNFIFKLFANLHSKFCNNLNSKPNLILNSNSNSNSNLDSNFSSQPFPNLNDMFGQTGPDTDLYPEPPLKKQLGMAADPFPNETYPRYFVRTEAKSSYGSEEERLLENTITRWLFGESMWQDMDRADSASDMHGQSEGKESKFKSSPGAAALLRFRASIHFRSSFNKKEMVEEKSEEGGDEREEKERSLEMSMNQIPSPEKESHLTKEEEKEKEKEMEKESNPTMRLAKGSKDSDISCLGFSLKRSKYLRSVPEEDQNALLREEDKWMGTQGAEEEEKEKEKEYTAFKAKLVNRMNLHPWMAKRIDEEEESMGEDLKSTVGSWKMDGMRWKEVKKQMHGSVPINDIMFKSTWP